MEELQDLFSGFVQGLTEFLPLSSSGHLALLQIFFDFKRQDVSFYIALHFGTLLTICSFYFKSFKRIFTHLWAYPKNRILTPEIGFFLSVVVGTIPAAVIGWLFNETLENSFSDPRVVGLGFLLTGGVLFFIKKRQGQLFLKISSSFPVVSLKISFLVGLAQALAILPGISRSGMTIAVGLFLGLKYQAATLLSFSLSVPIILGALVFKLSQHGLLKLDIYDWLAVLVSYCSGLVGLFLLSYFLKQGHLKIFSFYLWIVGGGVFLFSVFLYSS